MLWKLIKFLIFLLVLAGLGLVAFAYLGPILMPAEFAPPSTQIVQPVTLESR